MPSKQRVYVGNLAPDCRERDLEKFFKGYGRLGEVIVRNDFGFVDFDDHRDADDAVSELDGKDFFGRRVRVELAKGDRQKNFERDRRSYGYNGRRSPPRSNGYQSGRWTGPPGRTPRTQWRVIVDNISSRTSWQELKDYFRSAGDVNYCTANKLSYGVGMVEFVDRRGMENALDKFNNTELDGKVIRVEEEGRFGRGRSRSRSPVKRRSRSPANRRSRSPNRKSRSPDNRRSRSHNRRSRSPAERRSRSPANRKSKSPASARSRSRSIHRRSRSPVNRKSSRSPTERRSRSPNSRRSRSPGHGRSRSPAKY